MPEILQKKSPPWRLYPSDLIDNWKTLGIALLIAITPTLDQWASNWLQGGDAGLSIWGGLLLGLVAILKSLGRDNKKQTTD